MFLPRKAGGRSAWQHGRRPLHLCQPGGLRPWVQISLLQQGRRRLHTRCSVPDMLSNRCVLAVEALTLISKENHLKRVHFLISSLWIEHFYFFHSQSNNNPFASCAFVGGVFLKVTRPNLSLSKWDFFSSLGLFFFITLWSAARLAYYRGFPKTAKTPVV